MPAVKTGTQVYEYLPIGTLPVDMEIQVDSEFPGQFLNISQHRQHIMSMYNRYLFHVPNGQEKQEQGMIPYPKYCSKRAT